MPAQTRFYSGPGEDILYCVYILESSPGRLQQAIAVTLPLSSVSTGNGHLFIYVFVYVTSAFCRSHFQFVSSAAAHSVSSHPRKAPVRWRAQVGGCPVEGRVVDRPTRKKYRCFGRKIPASCFISSANCGMGKHKANTGNTLFRGWLSSPSCSAMDEREHTHTHTQMG